MVGFFCVWSSCEMQILMSGGGWSCRVAAVLGRCLLVDRSAAVAVRICK
jgi:hypothetical protein